MSGKILRSLLSLVLTILIPACNLPGGLEVVNGSDQNPTEAIQTQVAGIVASTAAAQTALANAVAATLSAMSTNTPEFTLTPSITSTPTFTFTPAIPMVSVSQLTNLRSGPGQAYEILGVMNAGQTAEVVGRSIYNDYWIIKLPSNPAITCWLWGQYATVVGNTAGLPSFNPPPTPTPKFTNTPSPNFIVSYIDVTACASDYAFHFQVDNNGAVTWESIRIIITDNTTATTFTHLLDSFRSYEACAVESSQLNLEPGEGGHVANINPGQLSYDPAGHNFTAVIKICSLNGLAGVCLEKTITFSP